MPYPFKKEVITKEKVMRMNRQNPNTSKSKVKNNCANYNTGFICSGVMIGKRLEQWIDTDKSNNKCLVIDGKECDYYDRCVKPIENTQ
tara:strand:+ start:741 stop:1004 length:264 start_codon:yes stop_codon:yes gene_type:complete